VQKGDLVRGSVEASTEEGTLFSGQDIEYHVEEDYLVSLPGMLDAVIGRQKGDEFEAKGTAPDDFPDERLRGKEISYKLKVNEVKEEKLAELDDAFAKEVGEGFESVAALRKHLHDELLKSVEDNALHRYETAAVDALVEQASLDYPAVMLENEITHILEDQANLDPRDPTAQALYLQRLGKSEQEVRDSVREDAERRLKRSLVMSTFAEAENIDVDAAEVEEELQKLIGQTSEQSAEVIRRLFDNENGRNHLHQSILTRKTLERLVEIAAGEPAEEPKATKRAPAKRSRSGPRTTEEEEPAAAEAESK
jgi:trigger factor